MTQDEAVKRYEQGETLTSLAEDSHRSGSQMRAFLEAAGLRVRDRAEARILRAEREDAPKLCSYGCGRPAVSIQTRSCLPCALTPPCGCKEGGWPVRMYGGRWQCRKCQLLMGRVA